MKQKICFLSLSDWSPHFPNTYRVWLKEVVMQHHGKHPPSQLFKMFCCSQIHIEYIFLKKIWLFTFNLWYVERQILNDFQIIAVCFYLLSVPTLLETELCMLLYIYTAVYFRRNCCIQILYLTKTFNTVKTLHYK